jgi:hydroxypyruvate reductase/glycerate 2-kinase
MLFENQNKLIENGKTIKLKEIRKDILEIFKDSLNSVDPYNCVHSKFRGENILIDLKKINLKNFENIYLIGFGKASVGMAQAVCDSIEIKKGAIITNDKNAIVNCKSVVTYIGTHPIPDEKSVKSTEKLLEVLKDCRENDLLIVLISGGGSALFTKPKIPLLDLQKITDELLKCGANIQEINTIRKHLSFVKGGQLTKLTKSKIVSFIISDIINDPIQFIASGPTYPNSTTYSDAKKIFLKYDLWKKIPNSAKDIIKNAEDETPDNDDPIFKKVSNYIVANNEIACKAAFKKAKKLGYNPMILTTSLEGEAKEVGKFLIQKISNYKSESKKTIFICGGETTVTLSGNGKGGRNQEMVLATVPLIKNKKIVFSSFATDGIDGNSDAAGAIADEFSFERSKKDNVNYREYLENNDSNAFFYILNDLLKTGSTGTNVMDIQLIIKYLD